MERTSPSLAAPLTPARRSASTWATPGTVMRFLPAVAALSAASVAFDGDPRARERPIGALLGRPAHPRRLDRRRRAGGAAVHHPRFRLGPRRRRDARRLRLVAAGLRAAAGGGAVRPRHRGASRGAAGPVAAAHRDDRADDRRRRRRRGSRRRANGRTSGGSGPAGSTSGTSPSSPTCPTRDRSWRRRSSPAARSRSGTGRQTRCSPPTRSWTCSPGWAAPSRPHPKG